MRSVPPCERRCRPRNCQCVLRDPRYRTVVPFITPVFGRRLIDSPFDIQPMARSRETLPAVNLRPKLSIVPNVGKRVSYWHPSRSVLP